MVNKKGRTLKAHPFCLCVNTCFDTICVRLLKSAYTCVEMRIIKLTDKLEFVHKNICLIVIERKISPHL